MRHKNPLKNAKISRIAYLLSLTWVGLFGLSNYFATQIYWEQIASRPPQLSEAIPLTLDEKQQVHIQLNK